MIIRDNYNIFVQAIMQLSKDKHEEHCNPSELKHQNSHDDELTFREILQRELHKRK